MRTHIALLTLLLSTLPAAPAAAQQIYLQADFDDKTIDQPIGTGGPELGEPVEIYQGPIDAIVRGAPLPTPCLEITDQSDCCTGHVRFEFLGGAEISAGMLYILADFWIPQIPLAGYGLGVREKDGHAYKFVDVMFSIYGTVACSDEGGFVGFVAPYEVGRVTPVCVAFDMTAGTYDLWIDQQLVLDNQPHDVTGVGIGAVFISIDNPPDTGDAFYVDNLFVGDYDPMTPTTTTTWGAVKALFGSGAGSH